MGHLMLMTALEEEFQLSFTTEAVFQMVNFRCIVMLLEERLVASS